MLDKLAKCGYLNISAFKNSNKALFIDRDGTLHKDKNKDIKEFVC